MADLENNNNQLVAYRGLLMLFILTVIAALAMLVLFSKVEAYSALLGGLAYIIPNVSFTRYAFKFSGKDSASLALKWFYIGEAIKLLMTAAIIVLCLKWVEPINMFAFFAVFVVAMMLNLKFLVKNMV